MAIKVNGTEVISDAKVISNVTAVTQTSGDDSTKLATTAFVLANGGGAPIAVTIIDANATWTKTSGALKATVIMTGGAGGRGNVEGSGAGSTTLNWLDISGIDSATVVIGAGGYANGYSEWWWRHHMV